ncbi:MAG: DUF6783 domain-containing protein [[Clostridium] symbiosum]
MARIRLTYPLRRAHSNSTKCDAQLTESNFQTRLTLCLIYHIWFLPTTIKGE